MAAISVVLSRLRPRPPLRAARSARFVVGRGASGEVRGTPRRGWAGRRAMSSISTPARVRHAEGRPETSPAPSMPTLTRRVASSTCGCRDRARPRRLRDRGERRRGRGRAPRSRCRPPAASARPASPPRSCGRGRRSRSGSASWSASSRYWVVSSTSVPASTSARIASQSSIRLRGSSPVVGSSRSSSRGCPTRLAPRSSRRRMPPE